MTSILEAPEHLLSLGGTRPVRVLCVFGTRPDAVKMAPVVQELRKSPDEFDVRVVVTGQHREQLDQVLRAFHIAPDRDLAIMRPAQSLAEITTGALQGLDADLSHHPADICLAQGDTTTTFVAALASFYHRTPFGHVEAGLRTHNRYLPFPEEMNRKMAASLASWHFAPTEQARQNLLAEGITSVSIHVTGNTSIDALRSVAMTDYQFEDMALGEIVAGPARVVLVTAHRRENWGEPMREIARAIASLADEFPSVRIVVALHLNPLVREALVPALKDRPGIYLMEPPDYVPFVKLMQRSYLILTDSGGVQEEAPSFGVPILVMRTTTERQEGILAGTAILVGTDYETIVTTARRLLTDEAAHDAMARAVNPYGDGHSAARIASILRGGVSAIGSEI